MTATHGWPSGMAEGFDLAIVEIGGTREGVGIILASSGSIMATWLPRLESALRLDSAFDGGLRTIGFRHHG